MCNTSGTNSIERGSRLYFGTLIYVAFSYSGFVYAEIHLDKQMAFYIKIK